MVIIVIRGLGVFILFSLRTTNNNSVPFFIIYVKSQQLRGQLQKYHSADISIT
jgi:hypothetical protein